MDRAEDVRRAVDVLGDPERAIGTARFFKTGPGEYGEGDVFVGVPVPALRRVARQFAALPLSEVERLLASGVHEHRLVAVLLLADQYRRATRGGDVAAADAVYSAYLRGRRQVNNWDLVDASSEYVVGPQLRAMGPSGRAVLGGLADSTSLWDRRIAVLATFHDIKVGDSEPALWVSERLLGDREDLIHKATGWMLREVGKRVSEADLLGFLDEHAAVMPRTMLRYAIERLDEERRRHYLGAAAQARSRPH